VLDAQVGTLLNEYVSGIGVSFTSGFPSAKQVFCIVIFLVFFGDPFRDHVIMPTGFATSGPFPFLSYDTVARLRNSTIPESKGAFSA